MEQKVVSSFYRKILPLLIAFIPQFFTTYINILSGESYSIAPSANVFLNASLFLIAFSYSSRVFSLRKSWSNFLILLIGLFLLTATIYLCILMQMNTNITVREFVERKTYEISIADFVISLFYFFVSDFVITSQALSPNAVVIDKTRNAMLLLWHKFLENRNFVFVGKFIVTIISSIFATLLVYLNYKLNGIGDIVTVFATWFAIFGTLILRSWKKQS